MASCSNSSSALVTSSRRNYYDVFVTFRGEDTRNNLTDLLFDALETKNISVFRDNTNLQQGESIGPELLRAIEGSQVYVAVFSRNYASSTWCMKELEKICECVHGSKKHVLPVFYDVDPSEVRKQSGIYFEAFVNHEQRYQQDFEMVSRWREALKQVGSISGWDLHDKPQAGEIKKIVQKIMNILDCKSSLISKDLVGINSRIEVLQNHLLLDSVDGVRAIGIWGMGGIGKTTLAMDLYGKISHRFGASRFIDDVNKICRSHDGPLRAQKQIILQTLGIENNQICNHYRATDLIRCRLRHEKALLILDNVEQVDYVMDVLQLSFDGLKLMEKEIFLDIACFFNGNYEPYVKNILNCCGFHADIGLRVLIDKSLIRIECSTIKMHSLLEELGRKIVQENSSKEQRKWSRLWSAKQFYNVKMKNMEKHVEAIVLKYNEEMDVEHLSKMSNLRLLIIFNYTANTNISGSPLSLSNKLRYVSWSYYPFKYLPTSFHPNELVQLILKRSSSFKQLWKNKKYLPNLRTLDLSHSMQLEKIIDFGEFPNLEWLNLEGCEKLVELDPSIGLLRKLVYLNLKDCENLVSIPNNIFGLCSLEDLNMRGCSKVFGYPTYLFPSLRSLYCLHVVDFSFCHLSQVPDAIECLHWLERLNLGGNCFVTLPSLRKLSKLVYLNLKHCKLLESLPQVPFPTTMRERDEFEMFEFDRIRLVIFNCPKLGERECCYSMAFSWMKQFIMANPQPQNNSLLGGNEMRTTNITRLKDCSFSTVQNWLRVRGNVAVA